MSNFSEKKLIFFSKFEKYFTINSQNFYLISIKFMFSFKYRKNFSREEMKKLSVPLFRPLCNLTDLIKTNYLQNQNFLIPENFDFYINEIYIDDNLLTILNESGILFFVDTFSVRKERGKGLKIITKFSSEENLAKSIAINRATGTLFIVFLTRQNLVNELKCCKIDFKQLKNYLNNEEMKEQDLNFTDIFPSENLTSPAFIEFDETNQKIITRNSLGTYKIWTMDNIRQVFELSDRRIEEIRTGSGILLTISSTHVEEKLLLSVYDINNGKLIVNYNIGLFPNLQLEILEIFDNTLLMKQATKPALVVNLINFEFSDIQDEALDEKCLFMYISKLKIFVLLTDNFLNFYSVKGELLRKIKNEKITQINSNHIHLSCDKNFLAIYWPEKKLDTKVETHNILGNFKINSVTQSKLNQVNNFNILPRTPELKFDFIHESNLIQFSDSSHKILSNVSSFSGSNINKKYGNIALGTYSIRNQNSNSISKNLNLNFSNIQNTKISQFSAFSQIEDLNSQKINSSNNDKYEETPIKEKTEFFIGEFEVISFEEDLMKTKYNFTSDTSKLSYGADHLFSAMEIIEEKISYFTLDSRYMRIFVVTLSGKVLEISL